MDSCDCRIQFIFLFREKNFQFFRQLKTSQNKQKLHKNSRYIENTIIFIS